MRGMRQHYEARGFRIRVCLAEAGTLVGVALMDGDAVRPAVPILHTLIDFGPALSKLATGKHIVEATKGYCRHQKHLMSIEKLSSIKNGD